MIAGLNLERAFKLRLAIARVGEMGNAEWWNTDGVLGSHGKALFSRGFPKTYRLAQARAVFEVARARSKEVFDLPGTWTLWKLPAEVEAAIDAHWPAWLDHAAQWETFFAQLATIQGQTDALSALRLLGLLSEPTAVAFKSLRREHDRRSVALPKTSELTDEVIELLAAGFGRGERKEPAIPYVHVGA